MENLFMNALKDANNYITTENGAIAHKTTNSAVYDMFALGGSYRNRSDADVILLFKNAYEEDKNLALKCLFYLRDVRGGQGERRFFRICFNWLAKNYPNDARKIYTLLPEYGRYDDMWYSTIGTELWRNTIAFIEDQLALDLDSKTPSLLAKWLPSENTSSYETRQMANKIRKALNLSSKQYRKQLSTLRERIKVVETLMSENRWDEIEFDKIPSKAGLIYKNAFASRDIIAKKYETFIKSDKTTVNAKTLAPYEIAHKAFDWHINSLAIDDVNRVALQKYWDNLPNYYGDKQENGLSIVDVSGSMSGLPMEVAVSMGAYIAEKAHGPFANHFITFSERPQLVKFEGVDIVDKLHRCTSADWGYNTNIKAVFNMLLSTAINNNVKPKDIPTRLYIFSDMEFDEGMGLCRRRSMWNTSVYHDIEDYNKTNTLLEDIAKEWSIHGYKLPEVIFWNLDARQNNIPALYNGTFSYVSGFNPVMIEQILTGVTGYDLMLKKLMSARYEAVKLED